MSAKDNVRARVRGQLVAGEEILLTTSVQLKGGDKREIAKITVGGAAASQAVLAATSGGLGLMVIAVPPTAWLVCTTHRVVLIQRLESGSDSGATFFRAPREAIEARHKRGLLSTVTLHDRSDGVSLVRLNFGVRAAEPRRVVTAINERRLLEG